MRRTNPQSPAKNDVNPSKRHDPSSIISATIPRCQAMGSSLASRLPEQPFPEQAIGPDHQRYRDRVEKEIGH